MCLVSEGTLYERIDGALEELIELGAETLGPFRGDHITLLDRRQTLTEGRQFFANSRSARVAS